ncbi:MAG: hypothetical protein HN368_10730 [Spirochaetales bacterium]|jgi:hypothetical protein|nr:hypothetical protein [Spirochaetales bacterium]
MALNTQHITGFFIGLGAATVGFYAYKKNQDKVDSFLAKQGIKLPGNAGRDVSSLSLEDLMRDKEHLEDVIAEREHQAAAPEPESEPQEKK